MSVILAVYGALLLAVVALLADDLVAAGLATTAAVLILIWASMRSRRGEADGQ